MRVVGICDSNKRALDHTANTYGIRNRYTEVNALLQSRDLDMVDITTPGFTHCELCRMAIENGLHILVEKPVTLSAQQAEELNVRSKNSGVKICVMQNYRFRDALIMFRKLQEEGKIGEISHMITLHHGGTIFAQPSWIWKEELSGGILYENAIHAVDLHAWLLGEHKRIIGVRSVYNESLGLTTSIQALVEHRNKTSGFLDLTWFSTSMFFRSDVLSSIVDVTIKLQPDGIVVQSGELGPLQEALADFRRVWNFGKTVLTRRFKQESVAPHWRVIAQFLSSIRSESDVPVTIDDVMPTMRLLDEINQYVKRGAPNEEKPRLPLRKKEKNEL